MPDITDRESLEDWLDTQPAFFAVPLAARAALRVLPLAVLSANYRRRMRRRNIVLPIVRAAHCAWVAGLKIDHLAALKENAEDAAARAFYSAEYSSGFEVLTIAARAARAVATGQRRHAVTAVIDSLMLRSDGEPLPHPVANGIQRSVSADASALERGLKTSVVSSGQLWPVSTPLMIDERWALLEEELLAGREGWAVWLEWYNLLLKGYQPDLDSELAIAQLPDSLWSGDPSDLNAAVRELRGSSPRMADSPVPNPAKATLESSQLRAALTDFSYDQLANLMRSVPFDDDLKSLDDPLEMEKRRERLLDLAHDAEELMEDLEASGSNLPGLANALRRYRDEAAKPIELAEHRRLWFNYGAALNRVVLDEYSMSSLQEPVTGNLREFVQRHLDLFRDYLSAIVSRTAVLDEMEIAPEATLEKAANVIDAVLEEIDAPEDGPAADEATRGAFHMDRDQIRDLMDAADRTFEEDRRKKITADVWTRIKMFAMTAFRLKIRSIQTAGAVSTAAAKTIKTFADGMKALRDSFPAAHQMLMDLFRSLM